MKTPFVLALAATAFVGCANEGPAAQTPAAAASAKIEAKGPAPWPARSFHEIGSKRFDATLALPDTDGWQIDDAKTSWLVGYHAKTESRLLVRIWRDDRGENRDKCEAKARLVMDLPPRDGQLLEEKAIAIPPGYDTRFSSYVRATKPEDPVEGVLLAFGGNADRCFAFVFSTRDRGERAAARVGDKLGAITNETLLRMRFTNELVPDIDHAPKITR